MNAPMAAATAKVSAFEDLHPRLFSVVLVAGAALLLAHAIAHRRQRKVRAAAQS